MLIALSSPAQTNLVATNSISEPQTNAEATEDEIVSNQLQSVIRAIPQYFDFHKDEVEGTVTISLSNYIDLEDDNGGTVKLGVVTFVHPPKEVVDYVALYFRSQSPDWKFLDDHDFTIRYDDIKLSPDSDYSNKILNNGTVYEQFFPNFTLQQFHDIAWADKVFVKLGYANYEIPYADRQKWKLLWKYFDLKKRQATLDSGKAVQ